MKTLADRQPKALAALCGRSFAEPLPIPAQGGGAVEELSLSANVAHVLAGLGEDLGLSRRDAALRACEAVAAAGGCDLATIMQSQASTAPMPSLAPDHLQLSPVELARVVAYLADRDHCTSAELALGAQLPSPETLQARMRAAHAMTSFGWTMRRHRRFAQRRTYFRPRAGCAASEAPHD